MRSLLALALLLAGCATVAPARKLEPLHIGDTPVHCQGAPMAIMRSYDTDGAPENGPELVLVQTSYQGEMTTVLRVTLAPGVNGAITEVQLTLPGIKTVTMSAEEAETLPDLCTLLDYLAGEQV